MTVHVMGAIQDSKQVAQMTLDDWHHVQEADPVLGIIIMRLREGMLEQNWSRKTDSPKLGQYRREQNNLLLKKGHLVQMSKVLGIRGDLPAVGSSYCTEGRLLSEDAMTRLVNWVWSACLTSCVTGSFGLVWLLR